MNIVNKFANTCVLYVYALTFRKKICRYEEIHEFLDIFIYVNYIEKELAWTGKM